MGHGVALDTMDNHSFYKKQIINLYTIAMQLLQKISILWVFFIYMVVDATRSWAYKPMDLMPNGLYPQMRPKPSLPTLPGDLSLFLNRDFSTLKKEENEFNKDEKEEQQYLNAHEKAISSLQGLLDAPFLKKAPDVPLYKPFLQAIGLKLNWGSWLYRLVRYRDHTYNIGIDCHFRNDLQINFDIGIAGYRAINANRSELGRGYASLGGHGLVTLCYVMHPNVLTNSYLGIGYGQGHFSLIDLSSSYYMVHWIKWILGSECNLFRSIAGLYGGMQVGIAHLFAHKALLNEKISYYMIPGYGSNKHQKIVLDLTLYLKWSISFLEKKNIFG